MSSTPLGGRFATSPQIGLGLSSPSNQTILPVMLWPSGSIMGFFAIASTTFVGSETSFALSEGNIPIVNVTLPANPKRVNQFMAAVYTDPAYQNSAMSDVNGMNTGAGAPQALVNAAILGLPSAEYSPWLGYHAMIDTNHTGYNYRHVMGTEAWFSIMNAGNLIGSLQTSMSQVITSPSPQAPPTGANAELRWVATMNVSSNNLPNSFFDFNWQVMFNASSTSTTPVTIQVVSNPSVGTLKAVLVTGSTGQSYDALGNVNFTTVRIIKMGDTTPGVYVFSFTVTDNLNQVTPVTLALTLV